MRVIRVHSLPNQVVEVIKRSSRLAHQVKGEIKLHGQKSMRYDPINMFTGEEAPYENSVLLEPLFIICPHLYYPAAKRLGDGKPPCPKHGFNCKRKNDVRHGC